MTQSPPYQVPPNGWRTFLIVWATQSISVLGSQLTFFAITIWLTTTLYPTAAQKPQLAWALSALSLSFAVPTVFVAPIAGAFVDRHDRKWTMIAVTTPSRKRDGFSAQATRALRADGLATRHLSAVRAG